MDNTNPAQGVRHNDDGSMTIEFYDTSAPLNTRSEPVVERSYTLDETEQEMFNELMIDHLWTGRDDDDLTMGMMLLDRDEQYEILDELLLDKWRSRN